MLASLLFSVRKAMPNKECKAAEVIGVSQGLRRVRSCREGGQGVGHRPFNPNRTRERSLIVAPRFAYTEPQTAREIDHVADTVGLEGQLLSHL